MSARMTEATIAKVPVGTRRAVRYCGQGLTLIVSPAGERYFTVQANMVCEEGWSKSVQRVIGYWPQMSLEDARAHARYYRMLAAYGVDIRRNKHEADDLPKNWRAGVKAKIAVANAYIDDQQRAAALKQIAANEARDIVSAAKQDARDILKRKRSAQKKKLQQQTKGVVPPQRFRPLTLQDILNLPWDNNEA